MAECIAKDKKFTKYSPGCGGSVRYPSGLLEPSNQKKPLSNLRAVKGKTCYLHYLENAFGIIALLCPKCAEDPKTGNWAIQKETDMAIEWLETYTYIPMELVLAPARHTWFLTEVPAFTIRCWFCGFAFFRGKKATKAQAKENERLFFQDLPEASGKLLKIIKKGKKLD